MSRQIGDIPTRTFNPGDVIFKEGDDAKGEAFMVHLGRVEIRKVFAGEERVLVTLKQGSLLGELALWRNAPRSATAIAIDAVTLMVIPANRLEHMMRSNPALAVALIRDLANRMLAAEEHTRQSEERSRIAEERTRVAEERAQIAEERAKLADERAKLAEERARAAQNKGDEHGR